MRARRSRSSDGVPGDLGVPGCTPVAVLGRGGSGTVYKCYEVTHARYVAVKVLSVDARDDEVRERFERECRALGALSGHPNIVPIHSSGTSTKGFPYIVMDYMAGGSVADHLAARGPLGFERAVEIGVKLAGALHTAHGAGIVHRDVKPQNVLLSAYEEPKLADFGISSLPHGFQTASGVISATVAHAAPEIFEGKKACAQSDQYSLASTIHTLITGRPPFVRSEDEELPAIIARVLTSAPPSLEAAGVPGSVASVVERGLSRSPADRFASIEELGQALRAAQAQEARFVTPMAIGSRGASAPRPAEVTRRRLDRVPAAVSAPRSPRVSKTPVVLLVAAVAALGGTGTIAAMRFTREPSQRDERPASHAPAEAATAKPRTELAHVEGPARFSIEAGGSGGVVSGVLRSPRSLCVEGREVSLWHDRRGEDHRVARARINADGDWSFAARRVPGRFYASVSELEQRRDSTLVTCLAARSRAVATRVRSYRAEENAAPEMPVVAVDPEPDVTEGLDTSVGTIPTPRPTRAPTGGCPPGFFSDGSGGCTDECPPGFYSDLAGGCTEAES